MTENQWTDPKDLRDDTKQSKMWVIAVPGGEGKDNVTWNIWKNNGKKFPKFGLKNLQI